MRSRRLEARTLRDAATYGLVAPLIAAALGVLLLAALFQ